MDFTHILIILLVSLVVISQIVGFVLMIRSVRDIAAIQRAIFRESLILPQALPCP